MLLVGYFGPETLMPLASAIVAVGGAVLVCWRYIMSFFRKVWSWIVPGSGESSAASDVPADPEAPPAGVAEDSGAPDG